MKSTVEQAPQFSTADAQRVALELFAVRATARRLPSERDQNFRLTTGAGECYVLKIANASERIGVLEFQNEVLGHIARKHHLFTDAELEFRFPTPVPVPHPASDGRPIARATTPGGTTHLVRLLSWVPGEPLARVKPHDRGLLRSLGTFFGTLDGALQDFDHTGAHRDFYWDLRNAERVVESYAAEIEDRGRRELVAELLARYRDELSAGFSSLRRSVIHNDGNDYNVLVTPRGRWRQQVGGVIDFGDMVHTFTVAEPAIAAAYTTLHKSDPLRAAARVVSGYHAAFPLDEEEIEAVFPLICTRLVMSVCIAAHQRKQAPQNEYLSVSEEPAWAALAKLARISPRLAHYTFRQACGMRPFPRSREIAAWLEENRGETRPVVPFALDGQNAVVLDLSVGSTDAAALPDIGAGESSDVARWTQRLFGRVRAAGARAGIGRYDEARRIYTAGRFEEESDEFPESRTVHLGVDLFVPGGTPVHAPLDAVVHSLRDNAEQLDYGPTIVLEHDMGRGRGACYTLYGHLSRDSLEGLVPGATVAAGQRIGSIGEPPSNGGWPPHLHFQIIGDMLGQEGNFPGVAAPSQRETWLSICPDPNLILGIPPELFPRPPRSSDEILAVRRRNLAPSLSLAYARPLQIVSGFMQFLYDESGRAYLDGVNNVCHVGHCHPRVVRAGQAQMAVLNTNTRYLHDNLAEFTERLLATLPEPLGAVFLVNSGSEANDLALRLARTHTGRRDVITVAAAYHGHTQALIEVSPYKFDGPGGSGAPPWVRKVVMPDPYRGPYRGAAEPTGRRYAAHVGQAIEAVRQQGGEVAAFICESLIGCGGQIVLPAGYLREAYRLTRAAGGVCIADEVQVGFGRVGTRMWGFQTQDVVPDIVTLGKPIGNGHPLGAVITTPEIAASFDTGMEYFNTFGGNPVSCAVGLAVLDVVRDEGLQQHALRVGEHLRAGLVELMQRHPLIGDVRGLGLFLGVELVVDPETLEPAPEHAIHLVERLKRHGILLSIDGPLRNVLKLKPPMVFDANDAGRLVQTLDAILGEDCLRS